MATEGSEESVTAGFMAAIDRKTGGPRKRTRSRLSYADELALVVGIEAWWLRQ
jgi:hypothetical protein